MAGSVDISRLLLEEAEDVIVRTGSFDSLTEYYTSRLTPGYGPTALHIALRTLDKGKLEIASMLIERGASIEGVANHLRPKDVTKFEDVPQLWDKLRVGITIIDNKEVTDEEWTTEEEEITDG